MDECISSNHSNLELNVCIYTYIDKTNSFLAILRKNALDFDFTIADSPLLQFDILGVFPFT